MKKTKPKLVYEWRVPEGGGAPLLCMPNVPHALHGLAPRVIMGATEWNKYRATVYAEHKDICEICGAKLSGKRASGLPMHHAHEIYQLDYRTKTSTFIRACCICPTCHNFIHSGRAITMYKDHTPLWTKESVLEVARHGFELVHKWNQQHPDQPKLKCFQTFLDWMKEPTLESEMRSLAQEYQIELYHVPPTDTKGNWGKWKLVYDGTEYYSPYQSQAEWKVAMELRNTAQPKDLFDPKDMEELARVAAEEGLF